MKTRRKSFTGQRPIFTGSPSLVQGGFNLDKTSQNFAVGDIIPGGTLAIYDEQTRKVQLIKTGKVHSIDAEDSKIVTLVTDEFYQPVFVVGDSVLKTVGGAFSNAPTITKVEKTDTLMKITLSAAITGLAADDILVQVVSKSVTPAPVITGVIPVDTTTLIVQPGLDIAANDKVMKHPLSEGALIADAISVTSYDSISGKLVLAAAISGLAEGASIVKVFADDTAAVDTQTINEADLIGDANSVTVADIDVREYETPVAVTADTMQYAMYERRVPPIPASQKDSTGKFLKANPHVKLSQSY